MTEAEPQFNISDGQNTFESPTSQSAEPSSNSGRSVLAAPNWCSAFQMQFSSRHLSTCSTLTCIDELGTNTLHNVQGRFSVGPNFHGHVWWLGSEPNQPRFRLSLVVSWMYPTWGMLLHIQYIYIQTVNMCMKVAFKSISMNSMYCLCSQMNLQYLPATPNLC